MRSEFSLATEKVEDWLTEKNGLKDWKSVVYLDGPLLEDWLAKCPAVASRWASCELRIAPQNGVLSTEEFWQSFSSRYAPPLVEDVLLGHQLRWLDSTLRRQKTAVTDFREEEWWALSWGPIIVDRPPREKAPD